MNAVKFEFEGKIFLKLEMFPVYQKEQRFYVAKIPAKYLLELYTVKPTNYDIIKEAALAATFSDHADYFGHLKDESAKAVDRNDFERELEKGRVNDIRDFLNDNEYALFPNTVILTCDLINDEIDIDRSTTIESLIRLGEAKLPFLQQSEGSDDRYVLYIPYEPRSVLVVDGQHRLEGLKAAKEEVKEKYEILVAFILGFDRSVTAQLFYTINYNQKPVSRSLLYQLMGEFSKELDKTTFMHETVKILNEIVKSPFYMRVKMLGKIVEGTPVEIKNKMTISQAFLIEYLEKTITYKSTHTIYPPIFLYYYNKEDSQIEIIKFILKYFQAISRIKREDWENPQESIICNAMGIGAFIRVMHFIFVKMFVAEFKLDPNKIISVSVNSLMEKLDGIDRMNFSKSSYAGSSASGLNQVMKDIIKNMRYFEESTYEEFIAKYKRDYLDQFTQWFCSHVKKPKE